MRQSALTICAARGDEEGVNLLLSAKAEINIITKRSDNALMLAASEGHTGVVKALLKAKADVDKKNKDSMTALMFASANGQIEVLDTLLKKGADRDISDKNGKCALDMALETGNTDIVIRLLTPSLITDLEKANSIDDIFENVPEKILEVSGLHLKALKRTGYDSVAKELARFLKYRKSFEELDDSDDDGAMEIMECLFGISDRDPQYTVTDEQLIECAVAGNKEAVQALLVHRILIDEIKAYFFHNVIEDKDLVSLLPVFVSIGLDINQEDKRGHTLLMKAAGMGKSKALDTLLMNGADTNFQMNGTGKTALMYAASNGRLRSMKRLLDEGAKLDLKYREEGTALILAWKAKRSKAVKMLVDAGANLNIMAHWDLAGLSDTMSLLHAACIVDHIPSILFLIREGLDLNAITRTGKTAFHLSVEQNPKSKVPLVLICHGFQTNTVPLAGETLLGTSRKHALFPMLCLLLAEAGYDIKQDLADILEYCSHPMPVEEPPVMEDIENVSDSDSSDEESEDSYHRDLEEAIRQSLFNEEMEYILPLSSNLKHILKSGESDSSNAEWSDELTESEEAEGEFFFSEKEETANSSWETDYSTDENSEDKGDEIGVQDNSADPQNVDSGGVNTLSAEKEKAKQAFLQQNQETKKYLPTEADLIRSFKGLQEKMYEVRSLKNISRKSIRSAFMAASEGSSIVNPLKSLHIPRALEDFLLFRDLPFMANLKIEQNAHRLRLADWN